MKEFAEQHLSYMLDNVGSVETHIIKHVPGKIFLVIGIPSYNGVKWSDVSDYIINLYESLKDEYILSRDDDHPMSLYFFKDRKARNEYFNDEQITNDEISSFIAGNDFYENIRTCTIVISTQRS